MEVSVIVAKSQAIDIILQVKSSSIASKIENVSKQDKIILNKLVDFVNRTQGITFFDKILNFLVGVPTELIVDYDFTKGRLLKDTVPSEPEKKLGNNVKSAVSELFFKPTEKDNSFDSFSFYFNGISDNELIQKIRSVPLIYISAASGYGGNTHIFDRDL